MLNFDADVKMTTASPNVKTALVSDADAASPFDVYFWSLLINIEMRPVRTRRVATTAAVVCDSSFVSNEVKMNWNINTRRDQ